MTLLPETEMTDKPALVSPSVSSRWTRTDWLSALMLVAVLLIAYWPIRHAGFIWDDEHHVTENPCIVGPQGLVDIWSSAEANYFPLVLTSFWVQHAIWGLQPLPYHVVNVLLHAGAALLLWRVLQRLEIPGAWLAGLAWGLHPVQVESVAWISEMKNTQSAVFYLAAIWFFARWLEVARGVAGELVGRNDQAEERLGGEASPSLYYGLALLCAACAILSKASTVMLPVALGLAWWWRTRKWEWRRLLWLLPFLVLSLAASSWTIWEQKYHSGALGAEWSQTLPERIVIAGKVVWFYLGKLLWPDPLIFVYPRWSVSTTATAFLPVMAVIATLGGTAWLAWRGHRALFFAYAYFLALLFPVLGFFNVYFFRYSYVGDHFQYLASMGPIACAAAGTALIVRQLRFSARLVVPALVAALCAGYGTITWNATKTYFSWESLWRDTLNKNPHSWVAAYNLGSVLAQNGQIAATIPLFEKAIALKADCTDAHINLANAKLNLGQPAAAVPHFEAALAIEPDSGNAHYNLGVALALLGRKEEAIAHFRAALPKQPNDPDTHFNLGCALYEIGDIANAVAHLAKAAVIRPGHADTHYRLGLTFFDQHRAAESVGQWEQTLALQPQHAGAAESLAWVRATSPRAELRNGAQALALAQLSIRQGGESSLRLCTLAAAAAENGQFEEAIRAAERARNLAIVEADREMVAMIDGHLANYRRREPVRDRAQAAR